MNVEDGLGEICDSELIDQSVEERIFFAIIETMDPLGGVEVEETVFAIFGQHFNETIAEFGVIYGGDCYLLDHCKILKPKI